MDTNGHTILSEDYVSFEVAKLLKEKGFDEPCRSAYIWNTEEYELCAMFSKPLHFNREGGLEDYEDDSVPRISAPTHQMVMKWLRGKGIYICPKLCCFRGSKKKDIPYYLWEARIVRLPSNNIIHPQPLDMCKHYETYEEAVEAALKYSLENLI